MFDQAVTIKTPPTAIIGIANAEIENSPNQRSATYKAHSVVQILAPMITPIALGRAIKPAPTKPRSKRDIRLLLCKTEVTNDQVAMDLTAQRVYFSR